MLCRPIECLHKLRHYDVARWQSYGIHQWPEVIMWLVTVACGGFHCSRREPFLLGRLKSGMIARTDPEKQSSTFQGNVTEAKEASVAPRRGISSGICPCLCPLEKYFLTHACLLAAHGLEGIFRPELVGYFCPRDALLRQHSGSQCQRWGETAQLSAPCS